MRTTGLGVLLAASAFAFVPDRVMPEPTLTPDGMHCATICQDDSQPPRVDAKVTYGGPGTIVAMHAPNGPVVTTLPRPDAITGLPYPDYAVADRQLTVTAAITFGLLCPWPREVPVLPAPSCDPYSVGAWHQGATLSAGGSVIRHGVRFFFVDAGQNVYSGHDYVWIDARDVR